MSESNGTLTSLDRTNHRKDVETIHEWIGKGWQAGEAFQRIKERKSYLDTHATFDKFCLDTFGVTARRVDQLIDSCEVRQSLRRILPVEECAILPDKPSHLEELGKVDEETAAEIWEEVLEESKETEQPITAAKIKAKVKSRKSVESEPEIPDQEPGETEPPEPTPEEWKKKVNMIRAGHIKTLERLMRDIDTFNRDYIKDKPRHAEFVKVYHQAHGLIKGWK